MKTASILDERQADWEELSHLCQHLEYRGLKGLSSAQVSQFAFLYRKACADLALADAYHLPPAAVDGLHQLVGRAHNQLYRTTAIDFAAWWKSLFVDVPRRIFADRCVQSVFVLFWSLFLLSAQLASDPVRWPRFAENLLPEAMIEHLESNFQTPFTSASDPERMLSAVYYIQHNTSIGLQCFAGGLLFLPGLLIIIFNAAHLGAAFGFMARPDAPGGDNFFQFVTAHGPFELTAIVLSAGAGLRLGLAWVSTLGWSRSASLRQTAAEVLPVLGAAVVLFFFAAIIEGFLSPSGAPYVVKAVVGILSSGLITAYFIILGFPWDES